MDIILPIKDCLESKKFITYSALAANKGYEELIYENLMNVAIYGEQYFTIVFTDNVDYNCILLSQNIADYKIYNQNDIISAETLFDILYQNLSKGYYCQIWADEFHMQASTFFHSHHYIHPLLIYGIHQDDHDGICFLNAVVFNQDKGVIYCQISLEEIYAAIKSAAELHLDSDPLQESVHRTIKAFIFKEPNSLPFDLNTFRINFEGYLFSKPSDVNRRMLHTGWSQTKYGLQTNDVLIDIFENISQKYISFTSFCHFIVCKQSILERLIYINKLFPLKLDEEIKNYRNVCNSSESLKMLNIKFNMFQGTSINSLNTENDFMLKAIETIKKQKDIESDVLLKAYQKICRYLNNQNKNIIEKSQYTYSDNRVVVDLGRERYIYEIQIVLDGASPVNPIGIFKIDGFTYLTDKKNVKLLEISSELTHKKHRQFEYELLSSDIYNIRDIGFCIAADCLSVNPDSRTEFFVDCVTDISENKYRTEIVNNDPYISMRNLDFPAFLKYIYIKCSIKSSSNTAQLIFLTEDEDFMSISKSVFITVQNDGSDTLYKIDMSGNEHWCGIIKGVRFDPAHNDNSDFEGEFILDYINFTDILPVYSSIDDYSSTQGVNSWYYYTTDNGIGYREMHWDKDEEAYVGINDKKLKVGRETQTACYYFSTVRRWLCPAEGKYKISCEFNQASDGKDMSFTIKHNHRTLAAYTKDSDTDFADSFEQDIILERGETIGFEFCSSDSPDPAVLQVKIDVENT